MKFQKECMNGDLKIPAGAMKLSGFEPNDKTEVYTQELAVAVLKKRMTALELIRASWSLRRLSDTLLEYLAQLEPQSDCCEDCSSCPYGFEDFAHEIKLPQEIMERANIPLDAVLHMEFPGDGEVCICTNQDGPGLWDIPVPMMRKLLCTGICPEGLAMMIESGETVYGN